VDGNINNLSLDRSGHHPKRLKQKERRKNRFPLGQTTGNELDDLAKKCHQQRASLSPSIADDHIKEGREMAPRRGKVEGQTGFSNRAPWIPLAMPRMCMVWKKETFSVCQIRATSEVRAPQKETEPPVLFKWVRIANVKRESRALKTATTKTTMQGRKTRQGNKLTLCGTREDKFKKSKKQSRKEVEKASGASCQGSVVGTIPF